MTTPENKQATRPECKGCYNRNELGLCDIYHDPNRLRVLDKGKCVCCTPTDKIVEKLRKA